MAIDKTSVEERTGKETHKAELAKHQIELDRLRPSWPRLALNLMTEKTRLGTSKMIEISTREVTRPLCIRFKNPLLNWRLSVRRDPKLPKVMPKLGKL